MCSTTPPPPPPPPLSGDNSGTARSGEMAKSWGRGEVTEDRGWGRKSKVAKCFLPCSQHFACVYVCIEFIPAQLLLVLCVSHLKVALIPPQVALSPNRPVPLLHRGLVGQSELIGRLTCFTTMDHWLTLGLHKSNHFYTTCSSDDTRQERGVGLWNEQSSRAKQLTSPLVFGELDVWGREYYKLHTFFYFFVPLHSAPWRDHVKYCYRLHCCNLKRVKREASALSIVIFEVVLVWLQY